jgi:hypothetical protein
MKKMLIVAVVCSLPFFAQAQEFHGGVKGGLNLTNLYIDDVSDEHARLGFHAGVYGQLELGDAFAIQPEILYSSKGTKAEYDIVGLDGENKFKLNYLDVPVLAVFKIGESFEIHAGPYVGFLLNSKVSTDGDLGENEDAVDKDNLSDVDFGLSGGVAFGSEQAKLGLRYNYGLVEVADSDAARTLLGDAKNSALQLYVSFGF